MEQLAGRLLQFFTPATFSQAPDERRRAHLIIWFGFLGAIFGSLYAGFYLAIDHYTGYVIILVCSTCFAFVPALLRQTKSSALAGNFYCSILISGFFCLSWVEGGMHGHALAWLVAVPLCALLLVPRRAAYIWAAVAFGSSLFTAGVEFFGITPPFNYPMGWHNLVSTAGYVGLIAFMFILGLIFENGRGTAHAQMEKAMKELADANALLKKMNEEKSDFMGIAAHDLKNPLTVVMGYSDRLAMGNIDNENLVRIAAVISREASRMRDLISGLLDSSALENGAKAFQIHPHDLSSLVGQALEHCRTNMERKQIVLLLKEPVEPLTAECDAQAVLQILDNLITNAIKFSDAGAQVSIETGSRQGSVFVTVSDRGPGISLDDQKKLFQKFTRLTARPTAGESSTGLGLSIVKRLVQGMGGKVCCESEPGKGAAFTVELRSGSAEKSFPNAIVTKATRRPVLEPVS